MRITTRAPRARGRTSAHRRVLAGLSSLLLGATILPAGFLASANAAPAPTAGTVVGNGFTVTAADLAYILKQIKISESHASHLDLDPTDPCAALVATPGDGIPDALQVPDRLTSYGLRTVDGSCNNLFSGKGKFAASDQVFPRLTNAKFRVAENPPAGFPPIGNASPTDYGQLGNVFDSQPRVISNLIVDQTSSNPAAVSAARFPVRAQPGAPNTIACSVPPDPADPADCVPPHKTLFIPNVTTDVGLSPPYNSLFTFFGQFFDHGVDQTVKTGATVFVPLKNDDPLVTLGPDGIPGNGDEVPPNQAFMVLTRAQSVPDTNGIQNANNTDTPWVDQSQSYTSHASHQVFLREYQMVGGQPVGTGKLLGGLPAGQTYTNSPDGTDGISTWAAVKKQAAEKLGLLLTDRDVTNVPMLAVDPYGEFLPGPHGLPQYVTKTHGLVEGNLASPVAVPSDVVYFDTPFLTDIAHNADPSPQDTDNNPATPPVAPVPDADNTPSADFAHQPAGTYDDEMLNAHFACGDGRCNENIALSTIHQIFHSEHDRLVGDITNTLNQPQNAALLAAYQDVSPLAAGQNPNTQHTFTFGDRLFQAARFVTEMEYQHLVFEEFARKVQPAVRPFHVYSPDINPAIDAEFAHAVYRFGHSMLDDTVARTTIDPVNGARTDNSLPLLTAFLNPPEYFNNGQGGFYTPQQAAGSIVMGSVDQTGNELDEFVTETLRNNLLGLPLDLATINMTRAREAGIPPLNDVRRQINAATNDSQLQPYTSWADFGQHLKHPESLINFVAAYGLHPSITGATTVAAKRAAARAIVDPQPGDITPPDAADFLFSSGAWASNPNGVTTTGLDNVDLWVGGLAEVTNLNGGLLGSTFNYVFQSQLEKLQDGDRFYYLNRTPGMNLRSQLEGNSFGEMIERNTDGTQTLKADVFATADCKFELGNVVSPANPADPNNTILGAGSVSDDPLSDCNENLLLVQQPDGTIQYRQRNTVDPTGINGQSVYNGTAARDSVNGGNDNDTFWGLDGPDRIEGNGGDDVVLGGKGADIITDLDGADVLKGGPGNDAEDAGPGDDIVIGADDNDFLNGGQNDNETFAGPGNDFVIAGAGADAVFGDGGDDWIEGGTGQDLLQGDHGAPFFDDPGQTAPGNDIFVGQNGENDYDAEGGDDLMAQDPAIDRNAGAGGFDWAFHQYDKIGGTDDDLKINQQLLGLPLPVVVNRDRWAETEADSGSKFDDVIRGDDLERVVGPGGFSGCDALDPTGVARIAGLNRLVTQFPSSLQDVIDASAMKQCPLRGFGGTPANVGSGTVWAQGNILLGGDGSDTIEGRGNDDIIDGDHALFVKISVRANNDGTGAELGSTDLMEGKALSGDFGPGTAGMTLQQAVFAGLVNPGQLVAMRELRDIDGSPMGASANTQRAGDCASAAPTNCDKAQYSLTADNYTINRNADGSVTVADNTTVAVAPPGLPKGDGVDTLWNMEQLQFCNANDPVTKNCTGFDTINVADLPVTSGVTANVTPASLALSVGVGGTATDSVSVANTGTGTLLVSGALVSGPDADQFTATSNCTPPVAGPATCTIDVAYNPTHAGPATAQLDITSNASQTATVVPLTGTTTTPAIAPPAAPTGAKATAGVQSATVTWEVPPSDGGSPITRYTVRVFDATTNALITAIDVPAPATSKVVANLTAGQAVQFDVRAVNAAGTSDASTLSTPVTPTAPAGGAGGGGGTPPAGGGGTPPTGGGGTPPTGGGAPTLPAPGTGGVPPVTPPVVTTPGTAAALNVAAVSPAGAEFVTLRNSGAAAVDLKGWTLVNKAGRKLTLPHFTLRRHHAVKIFTGHGKKSAAKLFLGKSGDFWGRHGTVRLYNKAGVKVATLVY